MWCHEIAAVGDRRVVDGDLQRRGQQIALADRQVDRVARLPETIDLPVGVGLLRVGGTTPSRCRYNTGGFAGDVDAGEMPVAQALCPVFEVGARAQVEVVADLVEVGVGRLHDGLGQVDRAVAVGIPVMPQQTVVGIGTRGVESGRRTEHAGLQAGDRVDHLESRAGRVLARDRAIDEWGVRLRAQELRHVFGADAAGEPRGIVGGVVGHGQHGSAVGVEDHRRAGVGLRVGGGVRQGDAGTHGVLGRSLNPGIYRQDEVVAGLREAAARRKSHGFAESVDLNLG